MTAETARSRVTFREIKATIMARITSGPWGPGPLLPPEVELAAEFGCSRATMNRALREVTDLGYLDRRRKSGTRVRMAPLRAARFEIPLVRAEIEATGAAYSYALIRQETIPAPPPLQRRLGLGAGAAVVHVVCLHLADGAPYQLEDRWINTLALPQAPGQDFTDAGPNEWLVATVPFSEVEISFQAVAAAGDTVTHLGLNAGEPVFCVERATWWQGAAITLVALHHRRGHRMTARY